MTRPGRAPSEARPYGRSFAAGDGAPAGALPPGYFDRDVVTVARDLLGAILVSSVGGVTVSGMIVETEAYGGPDDPASHAATRAGRTARNRAMFGPAGRAYVYRIYGVHRCLNVVTGRDGRAQAVLLRGLEPLRGADVMAGRRGREDALASGPGRLCQALAVGEALYGHDLTAPPLWIEAGRSFADHEVGVSGRVGVRAARDRPLRFFVRGSPGVSPARP